MRVAMLMALITAMLPVSATAHHRGPVPVGVPITCDLVGYAPDGLPVFLDAYGHSCPVPPRLDVLLTPPPPEAASARVSDTARAKPMRGKTGTRAL